MTAIIIPRKHLRQPQGRVEVDWANPLANGLQYAQIGFQRLDLVMGGWLIEQGVPGAGVSSLGVTTVYNGSTANRRTGWSNNTTGAPKSFFAYALKNNDSNQVILGVGATTALDVHAYMAFRTGGYLTALERSLGSFSDACKTPNGSVGVGRMYACHAVYRSRNSRDVYLDGVKGASGTFDVTPTSSYPLSVFSGALYRGSYVDYLNGAISLGLGWDVEHTDDEAVELATNPWQLFRADPIRIYSFPSGPIIPALSGLTTTNITQSGARHSLTLTF